jgi:hypothetical protein
MELIHPCEIYRVKLHCEYFCFAFLFYLFVLLSVLVAVCLALIQRIIQFSDLNGVLILGSFFLSLIFTYLQFAHKKKFLEYKVHSLLRQYCIQTCDYKMKASRHFLLCASLSRTSSAFTGTSLCMDNKANPLSRF